MTSRQQTISDALEWLESLHETLPGSNTITDKKHPLAQVAAGFIRTTLIQRPAPAAHMFPSDLEKFERTETSAEAYSVEAGHPEKGETVPLYKHPVTDNEIAEAMRLAICRNLQDSLLAGQLDGEIGRGNAAAVSRWLAHMLRNGGGQ